MLLLYIDINRHIAIRVLFGIVLSFQAEKLGGGSTKHPSIIPSPFTFQVGFEESVAFGGNFP